MMVVPTKSADTFWSLHNMQAPAAAGTALCSPVGLAGNLLLGYLVLCENKCTNDGHTNQHDWRTWVCSTCRLPLQLVRSCAPQIAVGLLAIVRVLPEHSAAQRKQLEAAEKLLADCCFPSEVRTGDLSSEVGLSWDGRPINCFEYIDQ